MHGTVATEIEDAVLRALRPAGLRERLRLRLGGGLTALQVWERLEPSARAVLVADETPALAERRGVERVRAVLTRLEEDGRVRRARVRMTVPLNTKGPRDVVVDVFRTR